MESVTDKQLTALEKFQKNKNMKGLFQGVELESLTKQGASSLMDKCVDYIKSQQNSKGLGLRFSSNFRNGDGKFSTVYLTEAELSQVREGHRHHCLDIYDQCEKDFADDIEGRMAVYEKRCDKVFTWIQQALDEKVRKTRGGNNGSQY